MPVFEPQLNPEGIAIYVTELELWIGVFACGGYFNLVPWVRRGVSEPRRAMEERKVGREVEDSQRSQGVEITLHEMPSSTSVFRTASGQS